MPSSSRTSRSGYGLEDSWVVEEDDHNDSDYEYSSTEEPPSAQTRVRRKKAEDLQPGPVESLISGNPLRQSRGGDVGQNESQAAQSSSIAHEMPRTQQRVLRQSLQQDTPRRRSTRRSSRASAEPELIMPSIDEDNGMTRDYAPRSDKNRKDRPYRPQKRTDSQPRQNGMDFLSFLKPFALWILDILGYALNLMKVPLGFVLSLWLLFGLLVFTKNLLFRPLPLALTPICRIPGSSLLVPSICKSKILYPQYKDDQPPEVEFPKVIELQSRFEDMLSETSQYLSLPFFFQHSRGAIQTVRMHVKYSNLKFKDELGPLLDDYSDAMLTTSDRLADFDSKISRTVDRILTSTRATQRELNSIAEGEKDRGALRAFLADKVFAVFLPTRSAQDAVIDVYVGHTEHFADLISRLLDEALSTEALVRDMDQRLEEIYDTTTRNEMQLNVAKAQVLSELWTMVGGNRDKLNQANSDISKLKLVDNFRQSAFMHVSDVVLRLQAIRAELNQMKQRVQEPALSRDIKTIPIGLQLEEIDMGLQRLEGVSKLRRMSMSAFHNDFSRDLNGASGRIPEINAPKPK